MSKYGSTTKKFTTKSEDYFMQKMFANFSPDTSLLMKTPCNMQISSSNKINLLVPFPQTYWNNVISISTNSTLKSEILLGKPVQRAITRSEDSTAEITGRNSSLLPEAEPRGLDRWRQRLRCSGWPSAIALGEREKAPSPGPLPPGPLSVQPGACHAVESSQWELRTGRGDIQQWRKHVCTFG